MIQEDWRGWVSESCELPGAASAAAAAAAAEEETDDDDDTLGACVADDGAADTDLAAVAAGVFAVGGVGVGPVDLMASFLPVIPPSPGPATDAPRFAAEAVPLSSCEPGAFAAAVAVADDDDPNDANAPLPSANADEAPAPGDASGENEPDEKVLPPPPPPPPALPNARVDASESWNRGRFRGPSSLALPPPTPPAPPPSPP